jgi:hypothetical protein
VAATRANIGVGVGRGVVGGGVGGASGGGVCPSAFCWVWEVFFRVLGRGVGVC